MKNHTTRNHKITKIKQITVQTTWQLFGEQTENIINELNEALAA